MSSQEFRGTRYRLVIAAQERGGSADTAGCNGLTEARRMRPLVPAPPATCFIHRSNGPASQFQPPAIFVARGRPTSHSNMCAALPIPLLAQISPTFAILPDTSTGHICFDTSPLRRCTYLSFFLLISSTFSLLGVSA